MQLFNWQKSSYSSEGSACVELATAPNGLIRLRESDDPETVLSVTPALLGSFLAALKAGAGPHK